MDSKFNLALNKGQEIQQAFHVLPSLKPLDCRLLLEWNRELQAAFLCRMQVCE